MEIKSSRELNYVDFGDLPEGSVFLYDDEYYMKFYKGSQSYNAVNLDGYRILFIENYQRVIHIKGYFVIED